MKSQTKALAIGVATAFASILSPATAMATGTCYAFALPSTVQTFDNYSPLVLRYIPVNVGSINTDTEAKTLGHLKQQAYSLVGKATVLFDERCNEGGPATCGTTTDSQFRLMTTVDGTIITGKVLAGTKPADAPGAHMGIDVQFLRTTGESQVGEFAIGPLTLECTSEQSSPTPSSWLCNVKAEIDYGYVPFFQQFVDINLPIVLEKLPANTAPACSVFRDGELYVVPDA